MRNSPNCCRIDMYNASSKCLIEGAGMFCYNKYQEMSTPKPLSDMLHDLHGTTWLPPNHELFHPFHIFYSM